MHLSIKSMKRFALTAFAATAMCVAPATAAAAPAMWTPGGAMKEQGKLELRLNGGSPITCSVKAEGTAAANVFLTTPTPQLQGCSNGKSVYFGLKQGAFVEKGVYSVNVIPQEHSSPNPWGAGKFWQQSFTAPFTNGTGGVMSAITLTNTVVGKVENGLNGGTVTATGTIVATTGSGGLITLK